MSRKLTARKRTHLKVGFENICKNDGLTLLRKRKWAKKYIAAVKMVKIYCHSKLRWEKINEDRPLRL